MSNFTFCSINVRHINNAKKLVGDPCINNPSNHSVDRPGIRANFGNSARNGHVQINLLRVLEFYAKLHKVIIRKPYMHEIKRLCAVFFEVLGSTIIVFESLHIDTTTMFCNACHSILVSESPVNVWFEKLYELLHLTFCLLLTFSARIQPVVFK